MGKEVLLTQKYIIISATGRVGTHRCKSGEKGFWWLESPFDFSDQSRKKQLFSLNPFLLSNTRKKAQVVVKGAKGAVKRRSCFLLPVSFTFSSSYYNHTSAFLPRFFRHVTLSLSRSARVFCPVSLCSGSYWRVEFFYSRHPRRCLAAVSSIASLRRRCSAGRGVHWHFRHRFSHGAASASEYEGEGRGEESVSSPRCCWCCGGCLGHWRGELLASSEDWEAGERTLALPRFERSADGQEKSRRQRAVNAGKSARKRGRASQRATRCLFVFLLRLCFCFSRLLVCDTVTARERWLGTRGACRVPACCGSANQESARWRRAGGIVWQVVCPENVAAGFFCVCWGKDLFLCVCFERARACMHAACGAEGWGEMESV